MEALARRGGCTWCALNAPSASAVTHTANAVVVVASTGCLLLHESRPLAARIGAVREDLVCQGPR